MTTLMAMYKDGEGLPRAFAFGPVEEQLSIEIMAKEQLNLYMSKKLIEGLPAPNGPYTLDIAVFNE